MTLIEIIAEAMRPDAEPRGGHWIQSVAEDVEYEDVSEFETKLIEANDNE